MTGIATLPGAVQIGAAGVVALLLGTLLVSRTGARMRAGRLLAGLSPTEPSLALRAAALQGGTLPYVAVKGSVDATEIFEDEHHRPLVYRRERVLIADGGSWREIDRAVRSVPFVVSDAEGAIAVDAAALDEGLIVLERRWDGTVAELHEARRDYATDASRDLVATLAASDPTRGARLSLEQVSTLDRATAVGALREGTLTSHGSRPLVFTTLERSEALRVVGGGRRAAQVAGIAGSLLLALGAAAVAAAVVLAFVAALGLVGSGSMGGAGSVPSTGLPGGGVESGDARAGAAAVGLAGAASLVVALAVPVAAAGIVVAIVRLAMRRDGR